MDTSYKVVFDAAREALALLDENEEIDALRLDGDDIREGYPIESHAQAVTALRALRDEARARMQEAPVVKLELHHIMPDTRVSVDVGPYLGLTSYSGQSPRLIRDDYEDMLKEQAEDQTKAFESETAECIVLALQYVCPPIQRFFDEKAAYARYINTDDASTWTARFDPEEIKRYVEAK